MKSETRESSYNILLVLNRKVKVRGGERDHKLNPFLERIGNSIHLLETLFEQNKELLDFQIKERQNELLSEQILIALSHFPFFPFCLFFAVSLSPPPIFVSEL